MSATENRADCVETFTAATVAPPLSTIGTAMERSPGSNSSSTMAKPSALTRRIWSASTARSVIVFAVQPRPEHIVRAAHDGVADFLDAGFSSEELIAAYDYARRFVERNSAALLTRQRAEEQVSSLSDRERQVLAFLLEGHSNKSMGKELNLSPRTVEDYRLNALRKLGVASTSAAIRIGLEAGLRASGAMSDAPGRVTALS